MRFLLTTTAKRAMANCGDDQECEYVEFDTLEQFMEWVNKQEHFVIMGGIMHDSQMPVIELYDDYRE